jgi:acetyltransferase-like isoleucine patch superfamily enzyme
MLIPSFIRIKILRMFGIQIHPTSIIRSNVFIGGRSLKIGTFSFININCFLDGCAPILIGDYVHIGPYAKFLTGTHTINSGVMRRSGKSENSFLPIEIKRGVWIGMGVMILPGVTIEEGCVIGAGAVVVKSTEPNGLYLGCPAKRVKELSLEDDDG